MATYKTKYCKACGKAHQVRLYWFDDERPIERFGPDTCDCGAPLTRESTSYFRSEEEYQRMRSEIEVIVI